MNEQPKPIRIIMHDRRAADGGNAPEPKTPVKPKRKARWPWVVALLLLVAAAAGAGVWWWTGESVDSCFEKAAAAFERKEYAEAAKLFRKAAERGHAEAQFQLAGCYLLGDGLPQSNEEAARWFRKAAEQGHPAAQFSMGLICRDGQGVPKSMEEAAEWFRKAAEQGLPEAQCELGMCHQKGYGVPQNDEEMAKWFRKAAEQGYANAQCKLGYCYETGRGVPQSYEEAVKWYQNAADQGDAGGRFALGDCWYNGRGVPANEEKAAQLWRAGAEQGDRSAQFMLGLMYIYGLGVPKNGEEAAKWLRKAAEQGHAKAAEELKTLEIFEKANAAWERKEYAEAAKLFRMAAERGHAEAQFKLAVCYNLGHGLPQDRETAVLWFSKAAEQGLPDAQFVMGLFCKSGLGSEEDAAKWFRGAAEQGHADAAKELEKLENQETTAKRADAPPATARPAPKPAGTAGRTMTLAEYSPAIDANLKRNIQLSESGQYLGAVLGIVAQGRGEKLAKTLGVELSGKDVYEMDEILDQRGCGEVSEIIYRMSPKAMQTMASQGYPYICRLKFWRAATLEVLGNLSDLAASMFRHGRTSNKANLSQPEMAEILGALGIVRGTRLDDSAKEFAKHASYFNLDNGKDRDAFANSLKFSCVNDGNLALRNEMSADAVFRRIKDIAAILAAEAGMPEAAIVRPAAADSASAGATGRAGNPGQGASRGGAGTPAPAASLSAALEAAKKAPTQENFERVEALWNGLPEERKTALQAGVMGAFCAMLLEKGDTSEMAKRMKYVDFQALWKAVSETCQACGGTGRVKEKCPKCGGSGKCPGCHGSGAIGGLYGNKIACPKCKSSGRCPACTGGEKEAKCRACTGSGRVQSNAKCRKAMEENLAEALRICRKEGL